MDGIKIICILTVSIFGVLLIISHVDSCNEFVCASMVSKCMLTQSCKCDLKNCTCCKECVKCLSYLYTECCSCVELCPKPNETRNALSKKSHLEEFSEPITGLFEAVTSEPDDEKWTIFTFPIDYETDLAGPKLAKDVKYYLKSNEQELDATIKERENIITKNCTVLYVSQCLSVNKCREHCVNMGASASRWFHDGCCECVGSACINYGINESRCSQCPEPKEEDYDLDEIPEDDLDYGDSIGPLDGTVDTNI